MTTVHIGNCVGSAHQCLSKACKHWDRDKEREIEETDAKQNEVKLRSHDMNMSTNAKESY